MRSPGISLPDVQGDGACPRSKILAYSRKSSPRSLRRKANFGDWSTVRQVDYAYWTDGDSYGNTGDLKSATVKDAASNPVPGTISSPS